MGVMKLLLPPGLPPDDLQGLQRTYLAGGQDHMPYPTHVQVAPDQLTLIRDVDESGFVAVPWVFPGVGRLLTSTATLIERPAPYHLQLELARGKVNQVRNRAAEWVMDGLHMSGSLAQLIRAASLGFSRAVTRSPAPQAEQEASNTLLLAYDAAHRLVHTYISQVFHIRHQRQPHLDTALGCRLGPAVPQGEAARVLSECCNSAAIAFSWSDIEAKEGVYEWDGYDTLVDWAAKQGFALAGGPLVDFSTARLPPWLWRWGRDRSRIANFVCDYVEAVLRHYQGRIRTWNLAAAANIAAVLDLSEDELMWLVLQIADTARRVDSSLELVLSVSQPWGEYLARQDRIHSPFVFIDTLLRNGLNLAMLDVEVVMGVTPRGNYCRDLLEVSRILDLYALLAVPLQVTLGYPCQQGADSLADPEQTVDAGYWRGGFSEETQADWAENFATLAAAKPYVRSVQWVHLSDMEPHLFPHCGLVNAEGNARPATQVLSKLRQQHLR